MTAHQERTREGASSGSMVSRNRRGLWHGTFGPRASSRLRTLAQGVRATMIVMMCCWPAAIARAAEPERQYSTCKSWQEVLAGKDLRYAPVIRVSDPGTKDRPVYTGFWFYDGLQFDESGRYVLAMKVDFENRDVTPSDRG